MTEGTTDATAARVPTEPCAATIAALLGAPAVERDRLHHLVSAATSYDALVDHVARSPSREDRDLAAWLESPAARAIAARARARGTRVFVPGAPSWPIPDALPDLPAVLLAEGTAIGALRRPRVAIVGTRSATPPGMRDAHELATTLTRSGVTIVSGLAIGIDAAAHDGALAVGGPTVGVVATGLDVTYPRRHELLFERVRAQGLIIGELAYGTPPAGWRFPVRNRIIAALADVVVVVEATLRGGARITAEHAMSYGRQVLAVPGSRRNTAAAGCNQLIADGAHPLLEPDDVMIALGLRDTQLHWPACTLPPPRSAERAVLDACHGEPATLDELCERAGLTPGEVVAATRSLAGSGHVAERDGLVWPIG